MNIIIIIKDSSKTVNIIEEVNQYKESNVHPEKKSSHDIHIYVQFTRSCEQSMHP